MAARIRKTHQDDIRAKIQAGNLINRVEKHISGEITLENSQIKCIEMLLDRTIPKLSAIELTGKDGEPLKAQVSFVDASEILRAKLKG